MAGWFEDHPSEYPKLAWFIDCDLVRLIWSPKYSSEERQRTDGPYPLVTSYRLLVSGSAFMFGMMKASFSYAGLGGAANVLDWILGVIITSTWVNFLIQPGSFNTVYPTDYMWWDFTNVTR